MYASPAKDAWRRFHGPQAVQSAENTGNISNVGRAMSVSDITVLRSSQIDAAHLDEELSGMLREQVTRTVSFLDPALMARFQPEIAALLDFLIFRFSVWEGRPLPGMYLMNLRYRDESSMQALEGNHSGIDGPTLSKKQRLLFFLGSIAFPYFWSRAHTYLASRARFQDSPSTTAAWKALRSLETLYRISSLVNSLIFLGSGRYRSLLERILRARPVYNRELASRAISYEYLNRQLVWAEVSEVLLFLLPLVNIAAVKRFVRTKLPKLSILDSNNFVASSHRHGTKEKAEDEWSQCKICQRHDIVSPYAAQPCGHVFCYYCIYSNTLADGQYECPECFVRVDAIKPAYSII